MGTYYYEFKGPITCVKVTEKRDSNCYEVGVFLNHQLAGRLLVKEDELPDILRMFAEEDPAVKKVFKGEGKTVLIKLKDGIRGDYLVSELGQVVSLRELEEQVK